MRNHILYILLMSAATFILRSETIRPASYIVYFVELENKRKRKKNFKLSIGTTEKYHYIDNVKNFLFWIKSSAIDVNSYHKQFNYKENNFTTSSQTDYIFTSC